MAANPSKLGVFLAEDAFIFVISSKDTPPKVFRYPFSHDPSSLPRIGFDDDLKFVAIIQKFLQDQSVFLKDIYLSLPAKDIIIRSFVIPFMKPNEVEGAVQFEVKKYIPFPLESLIFTYHSIEISKDGNKQLRILFAGIRKDSYAQYQGIMKKAGLGVVFSEPGPMSLVRVLLAKRVIDAKQKVAVLQMTDNVGRIIIVDHGIPQFIREFQLQIVVPDDKQPDVELIKAKLYNEVQISLDFFARQYAEEDVAEMIALSFQDDGWLEGLGEGLDLKVKKVNPQSLVDTGAHQHIGVLNAYGVLLHDSHVSPGNFNLGVDPAEGRRKKLSKRSIPENYKMTVQVIAICIGFSIFANLATDFMLKEKRKRIEVLEQHQGSFLDLTVEDIQEATTTVADKKGAYDDIRVKSDMTYYLVQIPQLLPSSAWLKGLQINYSEAEVTDKKAASSKKKGYVRKTTKIEVRFNGQVYHEDKASQIQIANGIVPELKKDPYFSKVFESIKLLSVNTSVTNDVEVTEFNVEMR